MSYEKHYSDSEFWSTVASIFKKVGVKSLCQILALYHLIKSDNIGLGNKALIVAALGYLIFPIDAIPDVVPVVGYSDDLAAIATLILKLNNYIDDDIIEAVYESINSYFDIEYNTVKRHLA